jgi:ATP-binding cassette, subfamily B, bacterial HlyB/CyaB
MINLKVNTRPPTQNALWQLPPRALKLFLLNENSEIYTAIARSVEIVDYSLGEQVLAYEPPATSGSNLQTPPNQSNVMIVCQGRIRLLVDNGHKEITAELLEVDRCFGCDHALIERPFAYRAVASSETVQVAQMPLEVMQAAFEINSPLQDHWLEQTQIRERLIFFRTQTALRSHPSHQLSQWMPYLQTLTIPAGTPLGQSTSAKAGRYWLSSGTVAGELPPLVGDSWGYSADRAVSESSAELSDRLNRDIDSSWVAQSDLVVYQLPVAAWMIAKAFIPDLDNNDLLNGLLADRPTSAASTALATVSTGGAIASQPDFQKGSALESDTPVLFPKPPPRRLLDALRRYPWVEQQSSSDCAAACLSMVARYWGKRFPLHVLRERANVGRSGASLKSLAKAAEGIGFHARPVRASVGALANQKGPWIAHWEGIHYVVVYRMTAQQVTIADPALGRQVISRQRFAQKWTGYGLLLEPTEQLLETEIRQASLGRYVKALLPYRGLIAQIIVVSLLIQCFGLVSPLFTQVILDRVVVQKSVSTLNVFAVGLLIFGLWGLMMSAVRQYLLSYFSNRLDLTLVSGFIRHVMALPMRFFESRRVGDIITRVQENQKIQRFLIGQVVLAWLNFLTGFVYLGLMLYYNWKLTLLVLLMVPPIVMLTLGSTPFLRKVSREIFKEAADQNSSLVEMVSGIATVKSTATEQALRWRWEEHLTRQMNARFRGQKLGIGLQSLSGVVNSVGSTLLLWYGATLVIQDQLTIGQFVAFNMMMGYVISPVVALAGLWDELQEVMISVERLNDVFETSPEAARGGVVLPNLKGEVVFEDVTFRYNEEEDRNTLQNISFTVAAGATVAIVGRSGSGKSTLVKLLEGLYAPNQGRVLIDGHDIAHVEPDSLRSQLGVVPQDCYLFSGTVLENITLYREDIPLEAAIRAAKLAEAHGFIQSFPMGYSTKVGERGATLSGGQRQRIAIARALLGNPHILILDEATSSLDTESERQLQQNLERISADCTTFIIAHRLSTVRHADRIIVLDRGVIVEQGTHTELIAQGGLYRSLTQQLDL